MPWNNAEPGKLVISAFLFNRSDPCDVLRLVIPIDRLQSKKSRDQSAFMQNSPSTPPQTLLRLIRIETPLEDLLPNKPKASLIAPPPKSDQTLLHHALKKKTTRRPKVSNPRRRPSSSPRKQK